MVQTIDPLSNEAIGARLRVLRTRAHLKQENLGYEIRVTQGQIAQWETGTGKIPEYQLRRLAEVLRCRLSFLVAGEQPPDQRQVALVTAPGARARHIEKTFKDRVETALGAAVVNWRSATLPVSQLPFLLQVCELTLLDLEELTAGSDMKVALKLLKRMSGWMEQAFLEGLMEAGRLLFKSNAKAVHFECYVGSPSKIIGITNAHFGRMQRVSTFDEDLWRQQCGLQADVYKIALKEYPALRELILDLAEGAYAGDKWVDYQNIRTPPIVAAKTDMADTEFQKYIARIDAALDAGRHTPNEEVHMIDGKADAKGVRYSKTGDEKYKYEAIEDMKQAQRLSEQVASNYGLNSEMGLRTRRLIPGLWGYGIREHISTKGTSPQAAVAEVAWSVHKDAVAIGSDRIADSMLAEAKKLGG